MKNNFPKINIDITKFSENYYSTNGYYYDTATLVAFCKEKCYKEFNLPLAGIMLDRMPWEIKSLHSFIAHCKRINVVDFKYPIILDVEGYIADGWHRLVKAFINGETSIKAIRMQEMPQYSGKEEDK
jgi:hypothetical protein